MFCPLVLRQLLATLGGMIKELSETSEPSCTAGN